MTIVTIAACLVIMIFLTLFVQKSKPGQAMRAVSEDRGAAQLMGINVNGTIAMTFAIGSALAAVAGVLLCSAYPILYRSHAGYQGRRGCCLWRNRFYLWCIYRRTAVGDHRDPWKGVYFMADAIVFAVLIIVLLVKPTPTGLLGKKIREKV